MQKSKVLLSLLPLVREERIIPSKEFTLGYGTMVKQSSGIST
jgi:hypothetical protein